MADFGDPSTWEMNVDQFIDSGLTKEKPQELLDLQEQNRKQRLLQSLQKIGPRLEDSSLDFINRENFAEKGVAKIRPRGLDSTRSKTGLDRMSDLLLKAYAEDDILHLANMPKQDTMNLSYFLTREDNIQYLSKKSGLSTEDIFDLLDDRKAYLDLEQRTISQTAGAETRLKPQREFYRKAEDWITKNAKRYDDPEKFKKAFKRTFPKNNLLLDAINSNKESLNVQFSDSFKSEMFGTGEGFTVGGQSKKLEVTSKIKDISIPRRSVDAVFKTAIYNLNPTVRNKLLNEFKNIVPKNKPSNKDLYNIKQSIRNNKLFKKFGVEKSIKGPIARLLYKDLGDNLSKQISALRQPRLQTTSLLRVFRDLVDPKYKNQFTEALSAIESANKKDIPEAKAKLNIAENINFDHKIPKSFIDAGYADEINYIKLNPTLESFNKGAKLNEFDRPMLAKARKYEAASKQEKPKILEEMQDIQSNFNERHANYLSNVTIKDVKGKPYFESTDLPLTKETNVKKLIEENIKFKPGMQPDGQLKDFPGGNEKGFLGGSKAAKAFLKSLQILGQPSIAAGFGVDELRKGNIKTAGSMLLAPEFVGSFAPAGKGILSTIGRVAANPFGKYVRAFTPIGLATIAGGAGYDVYKEIKRRQELTDEERLQEDIEAQARDDEMMVGAAEGGRIGFADGPDDPKRRTFMKVMAGIASLPILGKFFKPAVPLVKKLSNTTTKMPDWFPNFVDRFINKGIGNKIDADLTEYSVKELPDVKLLKQDNGAIRVEGKNAYNEEYYIDYEPPGVEVVDYNTGKTVKTKGDFVATDTEYRMISPEDYDVDGVNVDEIDDILGGSSTDLEGFAKGTGKTKYTTGQRRIDEADARGASKDESLRADINDPYGDIDPTDFTDD